MLAKALDLYAQPIKWDETSFNTTFGTKCAENLYFYDFPIQMYGSIWQKQHVPLYPGMLPRGFGLESAHLALSQHPNGMIENLKLRFLSTLQ